MTIFCHFLPVTFTNDNKNSEIISSNNSIFLLFHFLLQKNSRKITCVWVKSNFMLFLLLLLSPSPWFWVTSEKEEEPPVSCFFRKKEAFLLGRRAGTGALSSYFLRSVLLIDWPLVVDSWRRQLERREAMLLDLFPKQYVKRK